jgi:hypothetical protein
VAGVRLLTPTRAESSDDGSEPDTGDSMFTSPRVDGNGPWANLRRSRRQPSARSRLTRRSAPERRRAETVRRRAQGRRERAARRRSSEQALGRRLGPERVAALVGNAESVERIAGEHRDLQFAVWFALAEPCASDLG